MFCTNSFSRYLCAVLLLQYFLDSWTAQRIRGPLNHKHWLWLEGSFPDIQVSWISCNENTPWHISSGKFPQYHSQKIISGTFFSRPISG
ncbi:hypothetical protein C8J57DRAFT_1343534 [Mycena rebaudengoi]|nr:hypothetical protein C8J57DRAFT_1343534 [Mycena rebaudengoi]